MKARLVFTLLLVFVLLLAPLGLTGLGDLSGLAHAQSGGYTLLWWTVDSGGGTVTSSSPGYSLSGTIGQPDAGVVSGGGYALSGGFWPGATADYKVFLPVVLKG